MDALIQYSIPIKGLYPGVHKYNFQIDQSFFQAFENSPVADGDVAVSLELDKRTDVYELDIEFSGTLKTECDRCLAGISLPVSGEANLLVKLSLEPQPEEADVIYISPEQPRLNVAKYIYEFVCLAMPLIKVYDCEEDENPPCNEEMLDYLDKNNPDAVKESENNPIWDELKKLSKDK
ncbi:MAG: hypothetical protein DHS20C18_05550 [Saprospiraceae bacterium]|nr:MAG: hypothetical protein DHS20C18_05550 [Saprospiraceae bacterium]